METQHWTIVAYDDAYISREEAHYLGSLAMEIGRMLGDMMQNAESFCRPELDGSLKETSPTYFVEKPFADDLNLITDY